MNGLDISITMNDVQTAMDRLRMSTGRTKITFDELLYEMANVKRMAGTIVLSSTVAMSRLFVDLSMPTTDMLTNSIDKQI